MDLCGTARVIQFGTVSAMSVVTIFGWIGGVSGPGGRGWVSQLGTGEEVSQILGSPMAQNRSFGCERSQNGFTLQDVPVLADHLFDWRV